MLWWINCSYFKRKIFRIQFVCFSFWSPMQQTRASWSLAIWKAASRCNSFLQRFEKQHAFLLCTDDGNSTVKIFECFGVNRRIVQRIRKGLFGKTPMLITKARQIWSFALMIWWRKYSRICHDWQQSHRVARVHSSRHIYIYIYMYI